jgi:hypothetical protein
MQTLELLRQRRLRAVVTRTFPLEGAEDAHSLLRKNAVAGRAALVQQYGCKPRQPRPYDDHDASTRSRSSRGGMERAGNVCLRVASTPTFDDSTVLRWC